MAQLSTKIKEYCKENGVLNVDFLNAPFGYHIEKFSPRTPILSK